MNEWMENKWIYKKGSKTTQIHDCSLCIVRSHSYMNITWYSSYETIWLHRLIKCKQTSIIIIKNIPLKVRVIRPYSSLLCVQKNRLRLSYHVAYHHQLGEMFVSDCCRTTVSSNLTSKATLVWQCTRVRW